MAHLRCATGDSGDLFGGIPVFAAERLVKRGFASELTRARVLCRQLRRNQARPDKKRIAHLIFLNLLSMLQHDPQRGWRTCADDGLAQRAPRA